MGISMSAPAVAAYMRMLADIQRITLTEATDAADVQLKYIRRMEIGEVRDPAGRILRALTRAVNGSWEDVGELLEAENAQPADGRTLALDWAVQAKLITPAQRVTFENASREQLEQTAKELRRRAKGTQQN